MLADEVEPGLSIAAYGIDSLDSTFLLGWISRELGAGVQAHANSKDDAGIPARRRVADTSLARPPPAGRRCLPFSTTHPIASLWHAWDGGGFTRCPDTAPRRFLPRFASTRPVHRLSGSCPVPADPAGLFNFSSPRPVATHSLPTLAAAPPSLWALVSLDHPTPMDHPNADGSPNADRPLKRRRVTQRRRISQTPTGHPFRPPHPIATPLGALAPPLALTGVAGGRQDTYHPALIAGK